MDYAHNEPGLQLQFTTNQFLGPDVKYIRSTEIPIKNAFESTLSYSKSCFYVKVKTKMEKNGYKNISTHARAWSYIQVRLYIDVENWL